MRCLLAFIGLIALVGCQSTSSSIMAPRREVRYLGDKTPAQVRALLGKPETIRTEAPYELWTYRKHDCATLVYFGEDKLSTYAETRGPCEQTIAQK